VKTKRTLGPRELPAAQTSEGRAPAFTSDKVPLYYQLGSVLRDQIVSGRYGPGDRLPTEAELATEYGVSRITVRQALSALEDESLIRREAGRGTFVSEQRAFTGAMKFEGSLDDLITMAVETSVRLLELRTVEASAEQAQLLRVPERTPLMRCTRLRFHHDVPLSYIVILLPQDVGRQLSRTDWKKGSLLQALQRLGYRLKDADQTVRAALADATLAKHLDTRIGAPLLSVDRLVHSEDGQPVEHTHTYYRSDLYSLSVHLTRAPATASAEPRWALRSPTRK
jgi:GntR family transcriptional regulator